VWPGASPDHRTSAAPTPEPPDNPTGPARRRVAHTNQPTTGPRSSSGWRPRVGRPESFVFNDDTSPSRLPLDGPLDLRREPGRRARVAARRVARPARLEEVDVLDGQGPGQRDVQHQSAAEFVSIGPRRPSQTRKVSRLLPLLAHGLRTCVARLSQKPGCSGYHLRLR